MDTFQKLVFKAEKSEFIRWILNQGLLIKIPFNRPHGIKISKITPEEVEVRIPYKRGNFNHIKGIHACALATASEYVAGLALMRRLGTTHYRLIMESMHIKYVSQAKSTSFARFNLSESEVLERVLTPLKNQESVMVDFITVIHDQNGRLVSEANTRWQIKPWDRVKTKL